MNLVRTAIKELPDEQQTIIIMKFVEDLTNKEIAAALGKSEGAVKPPASFHSKHQKNYQWKI